MPNKCCVPLCRGNYKGGPKISVSAFPKDQDLSAQWVRSIKRQDFSPTVNTVVSTYTFLIMLLT